MKKKHLFHTVIISFQSMLFLLFSRFFCCSRWFFGSFWLTSGFAGFPLGLFLGRPAFLLLESIAKCPRAEVLSPCKLTHTNQPREYRESIACNPHLKTTYAVYQTLSFMIRCQMILSFYLLKVRALIKI